MTLIPLCILAIWMGLYPKPILRTIEPAVNAIVHRIDPTYFNDSDIVPPPLPSMEGIIRGGAADADSVATEN